MTQDNSAACTYIDATTFQKPLGTLAETLAQKVRREAPKMLSAPGYVSIDLYILVRQAMRTYDLFFYLNSEERRKSDHAFRSVYSIVILPLVRNVIDCLYNITSILQDPGRNGSWFRKSGYKRELIDLAEEKARYGGHPRWDEWIAKKETAIFHSMRVDNFSLSDVQSTDSWPTLGSYLRPSKTGLNPHQQFLKTFTYGGWREYSAPAHGAYEGLLDVAFYYADDLLDPDKRIALDDANERMMSFGTHINSVTVYRYGITGAL
jgi:hypothetical protein